MKIPVLVALLTTTVGCAAAPGPARIPGSADTETVSFSVSEGTALSLDVSPDGRTIVTDLLGQLWFVPANGGAARAITDAVRDTAADVDPSFSPDGQRIVFSGERLGRRGLWVTDVSGAAPVQIYQLPQPLDRAVEPAWSPDGQQIVFARTDLSDTASTGSMSRIAVLDLATRSVRDLRVDGVGRVQLQTPAWSPDGRRIAFVSRARSGARVWSVDAAGGGATPLTPAAVRPMAPAFSPDGRRIAYLANDSTGRVQLWVREIGDTLTPSRRLTDHADLAPTRVRWTPDGASLLYAADGRIRKVSPTGGAFTEVPFTATVSFARQRPSLPPVRFPEPGDTASARSFTGLALSPDAQRFALIALGRIWVAPVGGEARSVASVPHTARYLSWSADGSELAWSAGEFREMDVFATNITTGATRQVTALKGRESQASFSPDGRWLAFLHTDSTTVLRVIPARGAVVNSVAAARELSPEHEPWTGSTVVRPQWSSASDGILRFTGEWEIGKPTTAELVRMSGERVPFVGPNAPTFFAPTRNGLVWVRHDRLWTGTFDSAGMITSATPLGNAAAMYNSVASDGSVLYLSEDGLRLRNTDGRERALGWPVRYTLPVPEPLLIRNVRIIDATGSFATEPRDILIERGRISRIEPAGRLASDGRRTVDGAGGFAIPGLMELHAHNYIPELLPRFLYFGVTLMRDQGADMGPLASYGESIAAGVIPGPRVSLGGFQFYSDWPMDEESGRAIEPEADPDHVRRSVALADAFGAQHIKIRTFHGWAIAARMIREAQRRGLRSTGHCAAPLPLIAAGIGAKEHIGVCSDRWQMGGYRDMLQYDDVNQLFRAAGVGVDPTIIYFAFAAYLNERPDMLESDPDLAPFLPSRDAFRWMLELDADGREMHARAARQARQTTLRLARAGVTLGTGTDIWQIPIGVHWEMQELVAAGLSPMQALQAATIGSARIVGVERDLGTIEIGKLADIVLLSANPLEDIRNTRRITAVVKGGSVVDRAAIVKNHGAQR